MRKLLSLFLLLTLVFALDVTPESVFRAPVGVPVVFTIEVDATELITVGTDEPVLFSWTEKRIYAAAGSAELEFTPSEAKEYEFEISDGSRTAKIDVSAIELEDYSLIELEHNSLSVRLRQLELERQGFGSVNTADINRKLASAAEHLDAASAAYNVSRYSTAEIELGLAESDLDEAALALSEAELRPKQDGTKISLTVLMVVLGIIIVAAARYFLLQTQP